MSKPGFCQKCNRAGVCSWDCQSEQPFKSLACPNCRADFFCPHCDDEPGAKYPTTIQALRQVMKERDELRAQFNAERQAYNASGRERDELRAKLADWQAHSEGQYALQKALEAKLAEADGWRQEAADWKASSERNRERAEAAEARVRELETKYEKVW